MILPDFEIEKLCEQGVVKPYDFEMINPASLDVRVGTTAVRVDDNNARVIDIGHSLVLYPGDFFLIATLETFFFPNHVAAQFSLKSSMARMGLTHLMAGFCDPGWNGSVLTMELKNMTLRTPIRLTPGQRVGQLIFSRMEAPPHKSYGETGRYNGDTEASGCKK